ncbi:MAG: L-serine ammonia-lyase, iron-sulfur-dependent, subunit beta [Euryarchaeota archaeon]|nr:L-serine ammonia-lyase, iron-sulfur-dependent, subunit beta [Euryarchaeota archaeon]
MSLLDVVGPVMVGPSSSHTLGALRIARFVYKFVGGMPDRVEFVLHGSFADTGFGHGTDKALLAGIMGMHADDERIRDALRIANEKRLDYSFSVEDLGDVHPNTILVRANKNGKMTEIRGSSVGGGEIEINRINDCECSLSWEFHTLVLVIKDVPGAMGQILGDVRVNISNLYLKRIDALRKIAVGIVETDEEISEDCLREIENSRFVEEMYYIGRDADEI